MSSSNSKSIVAQYSQYLTDHISNVNKGFWWIRDNLPELLGEEDELALEEQMDSHDDSKYSDDEWDAYANYFYGEKTKEVKDAFDYAWLHHIHNNPHHWQYWLLTQDEDEDKVLDMPYKYILEMLCDHWAFSWKSGDLSEIFGWYESHKKNITFSKETKKTYEDMLNKLHAKLVELGEIE